MEIARGSPARRGSAGRFSSQSGGHLATKRCRFRFAGLLLVLAACSSDAPAAAANDLDAAPVLALRETLRLGSVTDPELGFSEVAALVADDRGRTYVFEGDARHVRVYDEGGARLRVIGGPGQGPGEFSEGPRPVAMGLLGDTLWVSDYGAGRLTLFDREGRVLATESLSRILAEVTPGTSVILEPGPYLGHGQFASRYSIPGGSMSAFSYAPEPLRAPRVRMDAAGTVVATLGSEPVRGSTPLEVIVSGERIPVPQEPDDRALYLDRLDDHFVVERRAARTREEAVLRITRLSVAGDTLASRSYPYAPQPWSDLAAREMMRVGINRWTSRMGAGADTASAIAAVRAAMPLPPFQPPVSAVLLAADESLWLLRESDPALARRYLVIGADGDVVGQTTLPAGATVMWAGGGSVWVLEPDALGVPWLVRYAVGR